MNRPLKPRVVLAIAVGGLVLAGCSSSDSEPTAAPATSASSTTSTPASAASSSTPSPSATPRAKCQVKGFVPSTAIEVGRTRPTVVWAKAFSLAPGSGKDDDLAQLHLFDPLRLKVRLDNPDQTVTAVERNSILASGSGPVKDGKVLELSVGPVHIKNDTSRNHSYLAYRGGAVYSGTWRLRDCGSPYNDGTSVLVRSGTYSTLGPVGRLKVADCGAPASGSALDRYAARRACGN